MKRWMVTSLVTAGLVAGGVIPAQAASDPDTEAARDAAHWVAGHVNDGAMDGMSPGHTDWGITIDALFTLTATGSDPDVASQISARLQKDGATNYFTYANFGVENGDQDRVGGALAKTAVAAMVAKKDPRNYAGYDLIAELQQSIDRDGADIGRLTDHGPNITYNGVNTFGQSLAVMAIYGSGVKEPTLVSSLLTLQCSDGHFGIFYPQAGQTCDSANLPKDNDATAMGLAALIVARDNGASGLEDDIQDAVDYLKREQKEDGGWGGGVYTEATNTNSTGLVLQALAAAGEDAPLAAGQKFIRDSQITAAQAEGGVVTGMTGAIAYNPTEHAAALAKGVPAFQLDRWRRATTQAAPGLALVTWSDLLARPITPGTVTLTDTTPDVGQMIYAKPGTWSPQGVARTYQWYRIAPDGQKSEISGATTYHYTVKAADGGQRLQVAVTGTKAGHRTAVAWSAPSQVVPRVITPGTVTLTDTTPAVGQLIYAKPGTWSPQGVTRTYQWYRVAPDGQKSEISGATTYHYTVKAADAGRRLQVKVTGTKAGHRPAIAWSAVSALVK